MDEAEREKVKLLESIRLQEAALSATLDDTIATVDSDSDSEIETLSTVNEDNPPGETPHLSIKQDLSDRVSGKPSWAEALDANQEYDTVLSQIEEEIKQNLAKVGNQVEEVQAQIEALNNHVAVKSRKAHWLYPFGMPYFKTTAMFPCPNNEDYFTKQKNNEVCWTELPAFHQWTASDKKELSNAIRSLALIKCQEKAQFQLAVLQKELTSAKVEKPINNEKVANLEQSIESFDVEAVALSMLEHVIANEEHDWMQISVRYLDGKQSPEVCRSFWHLYLHPKINKSSFTEEEEKKLADLVEVYKHQDWDGIAEELGTSRSGYQCFIIYQNKLNSALRKHIWHPDEDVKLMKVVEKYRIGDYIPWGKVSYHMEGRTKAQIFNRWSYSLNPAIKKGRFTPEEDIMILVGVTMWGEDFQRISSFLQDRTTCQIRDRYKHYLNRKGMGIPWAIDDDELLVKLVDQHGKNWSKIAEHFPTKDRTQVRHRHSTLAKWREKNPDAPLSDAPSRCYKPLQHKEFKEQWDKAKAILKCDSLEDMVKAKNNIVSSIVKHKKKQFGDLAKKKKLSVIEADLLNYFRCSYEMPGGHKKKRLLQGEATKYADELAMLLPMLKAELDIPSIKEVQLDPSLSLVDKDILIAFIKAKSESLKDPPSPLPPELETSGEVARRRVREREVMEGDPLFCDLKPIYPISETTPNIDYCPVPNVDSLYVNLPLMDFENVLEVEDRNRNLTILNPVIIEEESSALNDEISTKSSNVRDIVMCPPNFTTLVGMRTYLLNRRNLLTWANTSVEENHEEPSENFINARKKFDERLFSLFVWPALMSRYGPSNTEIFLDDDEGWPPQPSQPSRNPPMFITSKHVVKSVNVTSEPSAAARGEVRRAAKRTAPAANQDIPSTSVPPKKRKTIVELNDTADGSDFSF